MADASKPPAERLGMWMRHYRVTQRDAQKTFGVNAGIVSTALKGGRITRTSMEKFQAATGIAARDWL